MEDAIIALGMGGPDSVEAIRTFLYNLFSDREIINFHIGPLQYPIASLIAKKRSEILAPMYMKMGFGGASPQNIYTERLFKSLAEKYKNRMGKEIEIFTGMCYYHPYIKEAACKVKKGGFDRLTIFSLFPHYSSVTTGACFTKLNKELRDLSPFAGDVRIIPYWYKNKSYCKCIENRIIKAAEKLGKSPEECRCVFSAHSIPQYVANSGDRYINHISEHVKILTDNLKIKSYEICYQSRVGPIKWVSPSTIDALNKIAEEKKHKNVIIIPISFISDHIETLIELDDILIPQIREKGVNIERIEGLNDDDDFAEAITDIVTGK